MLTIEYLVEGLDIVELPSNTFNCLIITVLTKLMLEARTLKVRSTAPSRFSSSARITTLVYLATAQ